MQCRQQRPCDILPVIFQENDRTHHYEWINEVPLNGNEETVMVNFIEYRITKEGGDDLPQQLGHGYERS